MIAAKWFDMLVGVDIHWVMVPTPAPVPTPLPHPFTGLIFDPGGLVAGAAISGVMSAFGAPFTGPVLVNSIPAANTGTEGKNTMVMPHFPTPPGTVWAPVPAGLKPPIPGKPPDPGIPTPVPSNDAILITGSKTVHFMGSNACRLGDLAMSCGEPIRLPSSTTIAVPMGPPVLIGGPPALDFVAALMGAIRTQWVSGRLGALADKFLSPKWADRAKKVICFMTGHPVDVVSGVVMTDSVDFELPGPLPFKFERTYYSGSAYKGPLGTGWTHSYDQFLRFEPNRIVLHDGDGRQLYFEHLQEGETTRSHGERLDLTRGPTTYEVTTNEGLRYVFGPQGRLNGAWPLLRIEDRNNNKIQLNYDKVGHLVKIIDGAGRDLEFENDTAGRLAALKVPHPDKVGHLLDVVRFEYDEQGDLVTVYDALDQPFKYAYKYHLLVQETDRRGLSFYFAYDGVDHDARCVRTWGDGGIYDRELVYDTANQVTMVTDSRGGQTLYYWNNLGLVDREINPLGGEIQYTWNEHANKVSQTDPLGATTLYTYDERGRPISVTDPLGNEQRIVFTDEGNAVALVDGTGATWERIHDTRGNVIATTNPQGEAYRYTLDKRGYPTAIVDPLGRTKRFEWDKKGRLRRTVDRTGASTLLEYDSLGRLVRRVDAMGGKTLLRRDLLGRIVEASNADGRTSRYRYDEGDNLVEVTDPHGRSRFYDYGLMGKMEGVVDAAGSQTRYNYDLEGKLVTVQDAEGRQWSFVRDQKGRIISERDFTGREVSYEYDAMGRVCARTNARGQRTEYVRDLAGRLTQRMFDDGQVETFEYDAARRLVRAGNTAALVEFAYDACGRIVEEIVNGNAVRSRYDAVGNRIERHTSLGRTLSLQYDAEDRLSAILDPFGMLLQMDYDATGYEIQRALPNDVVTERVYTRTGQLLEQRTRRGGKTLMDRQYRYDRGGWLVSTEDEQNGKTEFEYDSVGRLKSVAHPDGDVELFTYDQAGHVPAAPLEANGMDGERWRAGPAGRAKHVEGWQLRFDADGNLVTKENQGSNYRYDYNAAGRLARVEKNGGAAIEFAYDPLGRRVKKSNGLKEIEYLWDGDTLLAERAAAASLVAKEAVVHEEREYVFMPGGVVPLAVLTADSEALLLECDQAYTPRMAVNRDGELVWQIDYSGFGQVREQTGSETISLRYPGQQADDETGLHYNYFRYYDPELRMYLTPDPMGLAGGMRLYNYVPSPTSWIDPYGLNPENVALGLSTYKVPLPGGGQGTATGVLPRFASDPAGDGSFSSSTWTSFDPVVDPNSGLTQMGPTIEGAMKDADSIHFNLEGMNNVDDILANPDPSRFAPPSTNWELATVLDDPDLRAKTTFYDGPGRPSDRIPSCS